MSKQPGAGPATRLTWSAKLSRLFVRMRDPEWRRYGGTLAMGKVLGMACLFVMMLSLPNLFGQAPDKVLAGKETKEEKKVEEKKGDGVSERYPCLAPCAHAKRGRASLTHRPFAQA